MEISFDLITLTHLTAAILGILSGLLILYFSIKTNPANQPLAIGQIVSAIAIFNNFSLISGLIFYWPHIYRLGHLCILVFLPMPYLFVVFHTRNRLWRWYDLLHAIPLMVFLIDYGHVYLMSYSEKVFILQEEAKNIDLLGQFRQSNYIGPGFHQKFRSVIFSFYWIAQVILFVKWIKSQKVLSHQNKVWKNWVLLFLIFQFIMFLPVYLGFLGLDKMTKYPMANSFLVIWLLLSSISLFFYPSILYGDINNRKLENIKTNEKIDAIYTDDTKLSEVVKIIDAKMDELQLYLKQGYSLHDLSNDIGVPAYQISKSLNTCLHMGFVDYINQKRIDHCVHKFGKREWELLTFEAMASECGFSNRNTFTRTFKKFQGSYPSDFKKKLSYREANNQ